ncbi:DUF4260 domain-containing protein [Salisaeta longa]|uniref:DUF4260 domain-containing protein n=1 Tax=Salisaeta longa TaxID=503170 RepID=UPI0003B3BBE9|nr:DUF4260 domain-containing protein [Salisaeta longa]
MTPRLLLRLEGLAVLMAALALYAPLDASWWMFAALLLVPDLSMAGYLAGPRLGAHLYNTGHTYIAPLGLGAVGFAADISLALAGALIWTAHIGLDRALGYGLKRTRGFHHTHLSAPDDAAAAP